MYKTRNVIIEQCIFMYGLLYSLTLDKITQKIHTVVPIRKNKTKQTIKIIIILLINALVNNSSNNNEIVLMSE
jgi:hypothetical protein